VSLNIYGAEHGHALDPDEITGVLKVAPTECCRRGERLRPRLPPHSRWMWSLKIEPHSGPDAADVALGKLLDQLPSDPAVWAGLRARYDMRFFFFVSFKDFNRGFALSERSVARAAQIGDRMEFDLYADDRYPPELHRLLNP
jgi:hypothetical protein